MIKEVAERLKSYPDFFVTSFLKISVEDMQQLRKDLKKTSSQYMVVKNSILKLAFDEAGKDSHAIDSIKPLVSGSCGILFSKEQPVDIARSLVSFSKDHESFKIQCGFIDGESISLDTIKFMATLPPKEVLLGTVVTTMKAPITGFVGLLGNLLRNLVGVIDAIGKKKSET